MRVRADDSDKTRACNGVASFGDHYLSLFGTPDFEGTWRDIDAFYPCLVLSTF